MTDKEIQELNEEERVSYVEDERKALGLAYNRLHKELAKKYGIEEYLVQLIRIKKPNLHRWLERCAKEEQIYNRHALMLDQLDSLTEEATLDILTYQTVDTRRELELLKSKQNEQ